ncbi:MAG: single-stranded-DNA-specific exonuclease RecJ [Longimicrobiales bacterium]|nr:single-stranded-DNA-specific exonuclease RecJ [Longimicrobiales bacterium]
MSVPPVRPRWRPPRSPPDEVVRDLGRALKLPEPLCRLLAARGHTTPAAAKAFLRPSLSDLHDPAQLADMDRAVDRLERALDDGETVFVHGDYDVDGMCAAALYTRVLDRLGGRVVPFVPHRMRDGYDLGPSGVRQAREAGAAVILTADCGIVAHAAVAAAGEAGMDVIVTDHHTPGATLPDAVAVVNPKREDCAYPNRHLSGTGVAYKVALALARRRGLPDEEIHYTLDLVALATVADVMPLEGENRILTRYGLRVLEQTRTPGLRALREAAGLGDRSLTAGHLSHVMAPRLNAVGRLEDAAAGLRLLLASEGEAGGLARDLEAVNARRQAVDREILGQALDALDGYDPETDRGVVLAGTGWHPGVIGIVASRVVERIHRPTVLIAVEEGKAVSRGSARSVPGFDLLDAIRACGEHLERFGGHAAAAGFDIRTDRIDAFRAAFADAARDRLPEPPVPEQRIDLELTLEEITPELVRYMAYGAPYGLGNPTPVFALRGVEAAGVRAVGDGSHLKLRLVDGDRSIPAIGFRMMETHGEAARSGRVDAAVKLEADEWRGRRRIQAKLVDLRSAG